MKCCKLFTRTIVVIGVVLGVLLLSPVCFAGGAVTLVPAEDKDVPVGSYIPKQRSKEIEKKVKDYKAKMKAKSTKQQQEQTPQN
jgi:multidrug efflux pump subunit AcrB